MIRSAAFVLRPAARAAVRSRCAAASSGQQWRGFAEGKGDDGKAKSVPAVKQEDLVQPYGELIRKGGVVENPWTRYNTPNDAPIMTAETAPTHAAVSWVSPEFVGRTATIYRQAQSAMTSGKADTLYWTIQFNHTDKWSSPLMGYLSAADPLKRLQEHLRFDTREQAIMCAKRNGWEYEVQDWHPELTEEKSYTFNYLPQRISKRMRNLGPRGARVQFHKPTENNSQWINHHHTDFGEHKWRSKDAAAKSGKKA